MRDQAEAGRLAELTIALSLASDLGTGQPMEHGLRTCWLSLSAAEELGLDAPMRSCVYFVALLRFLGCTSDASETAVLAGGDQLAFNATMAPMLMAQPGEGLRYVVRHLAEDLPLPRRAVRIAAALADPGMGDRSLAAHCEVAARLSVRLGMPEPVSAALGAAYERWDGKGAPAGLAGEEVPLPIRVVTVARDAELWARRGGWSTAVDVLHHRRGHAYEPGVVDAVLRSGPGSMDAIGDDPRRAVLDAEPSPVRWVRSEDLDGALAAVADFTDLTSPFFRGHSSGVSNLVVAAARVAGCSDDDVTTLGRAALVHDIGRVGVPNGIWDRRAALSTEHWERVRLHTYLGERVLHHSVLLRPFVEFAARHHERADGSGYHRGVSGDQLQLGARLLAAADAYHAMTEPRPHRPAMTPAEAAAALLAEVDNRRLGQVEVEAVLTAAGQQPRPSRIARPAGLTEREVDVLRLIARGRSNKAVAATLGISPKTVGHHIEGVYAKAGVTTRAGATLFAMENGLLTV